METIRIAGVACRVDVLQTMSYEQLFKMAKTSSKYYGKPNADADIKKELKAHGFTATKTNTVTSESDNTDKGGKSVKKGGSKKRK